MILMLRAYLLLYVRVTCIHTCLAVGMHKHCTPLLEWDLLVCKLISIMVTALIRSAGFVLYAVITTSFGKGVRIRILIYASNQRLFYKSTQY
jgi:hypothetical protein